MENEFEEFLSKEVTITSKDKAVRSRMSKARAVEKLLEDSLDFVVMDEEKMYEALKLIDRKITIKVVLIQMLYENIISSKLEKYFLD